MTRLFTLRPMSPAASGLNQTILLPPAVPTSTPAAGPPAEDCPTVPALADWVDVGELATVTASGNPDYGDSYSAPTFSAIDSTNDFGEWTIDASAVTEPLLCRVLPDDDQFEAQLGGFYAGSSELQPFGGGALQPYFVVPPGGTVLLSYYGPEGAGTIVGEITFRIVCIPVAPAE